MAKTIDHTISWEGRDIRLSYSPRLFNVIDHVEIRSVDGEPLPITGTGYRSHYFGPVEPVLSIEDVATMVFDWLSEEAATKTWKAHVEASRQGELF